MDYSQIVEELIIGCDLSAETGKRIAWKRCSDYADEHTEGRRAYNDFMNAVSARLGDMPVRLNDFTEEIGDLPENAKLHLTCDSQTGPVLTGDAEGLAYLAALCTELAREQVAGDHAHLWTNEPPLCGHSHPLVIYHEPDTWFEELEEAEEKTKDGSETSTPRDIELTEIAALCVLAKVPPGMPLRSGRLYRVISVNEYQDKGMWEKRLRDGNERFRAFTITNDDGTPEEFGFDLDDPAVIFFSQADIENLANHA